MDDEEVPLGKYMHYKGKMYEVIGVGRHTEIEEEGIPEEVVIYRALYDHPQFGNRALWVRPKKMFLETVKFSGDEVPRFKCLNS